MENKSKTQQSEKNLYERKSDAPEAGSSIPDMENKSKTQQSEQLKQMEKFYKKRLQEQVSAAKRIKEEFESFKDRVALDMADSVKTGDTESMNDPVSKTKLTEMYDSLRLEEWIGIKDCLKNSEISPAFLSALIERTFKDAAEEMERKKRKIEKAFGSSAGHEKVKENKQLAVHNLQIALYHSHKEDPLKSPFPKYDGEKAEDMMVNLRHLTSECHWLGCLLALNNPPLQPDWKTHDGKNSWDIFPHGLI
ncbi:uncharacterized protein LOC119778722 isoform X2 [Cyprinodon tularosa]|uniref:uncharacterized protein LOC119778722 isoform X2 n=1 Tax=Cyprinodon tularosa TaxID=77115 RepID=UPI0018E28E9F|nr:uncharacterized protein LOC119778722 isoform X2 [Cyprinodon tularosa]